MQTEDTLKSRSETLQADFRRAAHHWFPKVVTGHIFMLTLHFPRACLRIAGAERDNSRSEQAEGPSPEGENR
jgi:hypothetical protein